MGHIRVTPEHHPGRGRNAAPPAGRGHLPRSADAGIREHRQPAATRARSALMSD